MVMVYLPTWMVDPYGKLLGKITIPMDGMGNMIHNKLKPLVPWTGQDLFQVNISSCGVA